MKWLSKLSVSLISAIVLASSNALAVPPPDNSTTESVNITDRISVRLSDVDDIGLAIVWNGNGAQTIAEAEWQGGNHGYASGNVQKHLTRGRNYLMFVLYNKRYEGGFLFAGGKWSGTMTLERNGRTVWSKRKHVRENDPEIKYWKIFLIDVDGDGDTSISETIPSEDMRVLRGAVNELEYKLLTGAGVATPF